MRALLFTAPLIALTACSAGATQPLAEISPGDTAPAFELQDLDGNAVSLASYAGKTVVLEWFNPGCPYVVAAHTDGPLSDQAGRVVSDDVVWLAINSGAPGKQGHGLDANRAAAAEWSMAHPILIDETGTIGRAYGATNTPQMVVVKPDGTVGYYGAVDNAPLGNQQGGTYTNYVDAALTDLAAGNDIAQARTRPYGCSVKY